MSRWRRSHEIPGLASDTSKSPGKLQLEVSRSKDALASLTTDHAADSLEGMAKTQILLPSASSEVLNLEDVLSELRQHFENHDRLMLCEIARLMSHGALLCMKRHKINLKALAQIESSGLAMEAHGRHMYFTRSSDCRSTVEPIRNGRWRKKHEGDRGQEIKVAESGSKHKCSASNLMSKSSQRNARRQKLRQERRETAKRVLQRKREHETCIVWLRNDLRLADNPALHAAAESGRAVVPVFLHDDSDPCPWPVHGAALWWKHKSIEAFRDSLRSECDCCLVLRRGVAQETLQMLCEEVGASALYFNRQVEPWYVERDRAIQNTIQKAGIEVHTFKAVVLAEPWEVCKSASAQQTQENSQEQISQDPVHLRTKVDQARPNGLWEDNLRVAHQDDGHLARDCAPLPSVAGMIFQKPGAWPHSLTLFDLGYGRTAGKGFPKAMEQFRECTVDHSGNASRSDWASEIAKNWKVGEVAATQRLQRFFTDVLSCGLHERPHRLRADECWTSALSPYIRFGEISPRTCYAEALKRDLHKRKPFVRRLLWRDLAYAELYRYPTLPVKSLRIQYEEQVWSGKRSHLQRWQRGRTGFPLVDAGMRQLWQIGWLPNYMRHITAQFLINLLDISWKEGFCWYDYTLIDSDVAINAHMWQNGGHSGTSQWSFFLHPVRVAQHADPEGRYVRRWVPELSWLPPEFIHCPWTAPVGLRSSTLLGIEYCERIIKDLVSAMRSHVRKVFVVRKAHPELIAKNGHDVLLLEKGRRAVLWTREDLRLFDETKSVAMASEGSSQQHKASHVTLIGLQNALLDTEVELAYTRDFQTSDFL